MRKPAKQKVAIVHKRLLAWYRKNKRSFFWRNTSNTYEILVSEIMLQQTQASRVEEKLPIFLQKFPDFESIANASKAEVIRAWRGMGYNNRAIRLKELATIVVEKYHSQLPNQPDELIQLPGIGKYTAHAITCFGFRKHVPVVDVNIQRVLSRVFSKMSSHTEMQLVKGIWLLASKVLPRDSYSWNQALMELGSTLCKARSTQCGECPIAEVCASKQLGSIETKRILTLNSKEKKYDGIPLRLWRGKIVEALRNVNGEGSVTLAELGKRIKKDFNSKESLRLQSLIDSLEKDGIAQTEKRGRLTLLMLAE